MGGQIDWDVSMTSNGCAIDEQTKYVGWPGLVGMAWLGSLAGLAGLTVEQVNGMSPLGIFVGRVL